MKFKTLLALLLALALCLAPVSAFAAGEEAAATGLGDELPDFSFTTFDGKEYTLSEVLKEKDMVLINLWATWCGPCEMEFPYMEAAYEQYKDQVEIFALSVEPEDTDEVLADYVASHGMTFPVGRDEAGLDAIFNTGAIPTSLVVDRNGVLCAMEVGSQSSEDAFHMLFDEFVGEDYDEPNVLADGFPKPPPATPTVEPTDPEELAEALLGESAVEVTVVNPEDPYNWPMVVSKDAGAVSEDGEPACVTISNTGIDNSSSSLLLQFTTEEDAAFAVDYKLSTEAGYDTMTIAPDDEPGKTLSGEWDWRTYACQLEPGEHIVALSYYKDEMEAGGDDAVWFSNFRVVTGDDIAEVMALMPQYPFADETSITVTSEDAKEIVFEDPDGVLADAFGSAQYFIVPQEYTVYATLSEGSDPEATYFYNFYDGDSVFFATCVDGDGYTYEAKGVDSMEETDYCYCYVTLESDTDFAAVVTFASEENANAFLDEAELPGWTYADGAEPSTDERAVYGGDAETGDGMSDYSLSFVDEDGEPVEGVIANVCDDSACTPMTSGADGLIEFTYPSFAYHIQVIKVPDGYEYDTSEETYLDEAGDAVTFTLKAAE